MVLFGDVVRSRVDPTASTAWLRTLVAELETGYPPDDRMAPIGMTQGDEVQMLLRADADPFAAVLRAGLHPDRRAMRWAVAFGAIDQGSGPATERTGPAFLVARGLLDSPAGRRDRLRIATGDAAADRLLDDLAPLLVDLLDDLTSRQAEVGRLLLLDGLRRAEAAARLGVSRATISVVADRARVRGIARLVRALRTIVHAAHGGDR
jgi:hypothetical protein